MVTRWAKKFVTAGYVGLGGRNEFESIPIRISSLEKIQERRHGERRVDNEPAEGWPVFAPQDPEKFIYQERRAGDRRQRIITPPIR